MAEKVTPLAVHQLFHGRGAGVLLHLSSLPDRGRGLDHAKRFADWLASAGVKWWQMLPVGPVPNPSWSPYSAMSSFRLGEFVNGDWDSFRSYCASLGIKLFGDLPIFVPVESEDVRNNPQLFRLQADGTPEVSTGVPPDNFSPTGQMWGHPHYAWEQHRKENFAWWLKRFAYHLELFDAVRIDHFIGFHHAWEIQAGEATAVNGIWQAAPGHDLLQALAGKMAGPLPLVAEDLGHITPDVVALRDNFGLPGMYVLQAGHEPALENSFAYTGTHDNDTMAGWLLRRGLSDRPWSWIEKLFKSVSNNAIVPMQDLLELDSTARMNVPGTKDGNWNWHFDADLLASSDGVELAARLRDLVADTDRQQHDT